MFLLRHVRAAAARVQRGSSLSTTPATASQLSSYTEAMYSHWQKDPKSVDQSWKQHFEKHGAAELGSLRSKAGLPTLDSKELLDNLKVGRC